MGDAEQDTRNSRWLSEAGDREAVLDPAEILTRHGADPSSAMESADATEKYFSRLQIGFRPLVGQDGFRALAREALRRTVRLHPVLERCGSKDDGEAFFVGLGGSLSREDPEAVWNGLQALTGEFLRLVDGMGRREEIAAAVRNENSSSDLEGDINTTATARSDSLEEQERGKEADHVRSSDPWRVLVMDRDRVTCEAMIHALGEAPDFHVVGYGLNPDEIQERLVRDEADFVVASSHLPSEDVLEVCRWLRREHTGELPHVVVTGLPPDEAVILKFLEAGSAAFTLEDFSVEGLRQTMRLLARGEAVFSLRLQHLMSMRLSELAELVRDRGLNPDALSELTAREGEVLLLLEEGLTNREVAKRLYISEGTVKSHVHQVLRKLNVRNRKEAVRVLRLQRAAPGKLVLGRSGFRKEKAPDQPDT